MKEIAVFSGNVDLSWYGDAGYFTKDSKTVSRFGIVENEADLVRILCDEFMDAAQMREPLSETAVVLFLVPGILTIS